MYLRKTDEFSFLLKRSGVCDGVGVFALHGIAKGTKLRLFGDLEKQEEFVRLVNVNDIPYEALRRYCIKLGDQLLAPKDFGHMTVGWYLNHSEAPNARHTDFTYEALRDIDAGEEITINYASLEEGAEDREDFYK